jgi:hypothetical protein
MAIIIFATVVYTNLKKVWRNEVERNWTITYFTSVFQVFLNKGLIFLHRLFI